MMNIHITSLIQPTQKAARLISPIEPSHLRGLHYRAELSFAPPAFSHHALRAVYQPLELTKPAIRFQSPPELERSGFAAQLCPLGGDGI